MATTYVARTIRVIVVVSFLASLSSLPIFGQSSDDAGHAGMEDAIRETVLRYQMFGWTSDSSKPEKSSNYKDEKTAEKHLKAHVYFVSVNGKDPTDEFLNRFTDVPRTIKKVSRAKQTKKFPGWVIDKKTKQPGIIFSANEIRWIKDDLVEVEGGYHCGGLCAAGDLFTVQFADGKWKVVEDRTEWIS